MKYISLLKNLTSERQNIFQQDLNQQMQQNFADFVKQTDFDDNLKNVYKQITSNKTKHVAVGKKLLIYQKKLNNQQQKMTCF